MTRDKQLEEKLWEYVYDLLPDDEKQDWTARITSEPEVARAYAEIKMQSEVVAEAVRVNEPSMRWGQSALEEDSDKPQRLPLGKTRRAASGGRGRMWGNWLAAAAAVLLIAMISTARLKQSPQDRLVAVVADNNASSVRTTIYGPSTLVDGVSNTITVQTRDLARNTPRPVDVEVAIRDDRNQVVWQESAKTDANGVLMVSIPAPLAQNEYSFLANARQAPAETSAVWPIHVAPQQLVTHLATDRTVYAPGEPLYYRSVTLAKPGAQDAGELAVEYKVTRENDTDGRDVLEDSIQTSRTVRGVGANSYQLGMSLEEGEYAVVVSSADRRFRDATRRFYVERPDDARFRIDVEFSKSGYVAGEQVEVDVAALNMDGTPLDKTEFEFRAGVADQLLAEARFDANSDGTRQFQFSLPTELPNGPGYLEVAARHDDLWERQFARIPLQRSEIDLHFYPEGGQLVADLPNRVYFEARNAAGQPVAARGQLVDSLGQNVVTFETPPGETSGRGRFEFEPQSGQTYRVELEPPGSAATDVTLTPADFDFAATLNSGEGVFGAEQPIALDIQANRGARHLVASVACGGVEVGQLGFDSRRGTTRIEVPVSPDAEGVLRVTLFDFMESPPKALAERLVFRRPAKKLHLAAVDPIVAIEGRKARIELQVTNEQAGPADAMVGAVVRQVHRFVGDEDRSSLNSDYLLLSEIDEPAAWEDVRIYLADSAAAARSLDLLLGTRGWRRIEEMSQRQVAMRFGRALDERRAGKREEIAEFDDASMVVQPPSVADNLEQVLALPIPSATKTSSDVSGSRSVVPMVGRVVLLTSGTVLMVMFVFAVFRLASVWLWLPTAGLAIVALFLAISWIGGFDKLERSAGSPTAGSAVDVAAPAGAEMASSPEDGDKQGEGFNLADAAASPTTDDAAGMGGGGGGLGGLGAGKALMKNTEIAPAERSIAPKGAAGDVANVARPTSPTEPLPSKDESAPGSAGSAAPSAVVPSSMARGKLDATRDLRELPGRRVTSEFRFDKYLLDDVERRQRLLEEKLAESAQRADLEQVTRSRASGPIDPTPSGQETLQIRLYSQYAFNAKEFQSQEPPATLYWHPMLVPSPDGKLSVDFDFPATPPNGKSAEWELHAVAHGAARLGEMRSMIQAETPLGLQFELPRVLVAGDEITARLMVTNREQTDAKVEIQVEANEFFDVEPSDQTVAVPALQTESTFAKLRARRVGNSSVAWRATSENAATRWRDSLVVESTGYAISKTQGGMLSQQTLLDPSSMGTPDTEHTTGSIELGLRVYPSLASEVRDAAGELILVRRESPWCRLASDLTLRWLTNHGVADPALKRGLKRWAGTSVKNDSQEVTLTDAWESAWYRAETGASSAAEREQRRWPDERAEPYVVALAARLALLDEASNAPELVDRVARLQQPDGHLPCERMFVAADGTATSLEATVYAILAWSHPTVAEQYAPQRAAALAWLRRQRRANGGFGTPEASALAMLALLQDTSRPVLADEDQSISVSGQAGNEGLTVPVAAGSARHVEWHQEFIAAELPERLTLVGSASQPIPYVFSALFHTSEPPRVARAPWTISTRLDADEIQLGERTTIHVRIEGQSAAPAVLHIGLPAGLMVDMRSLPPTCEVDGNVLLIRVASPFVEPREWVKGDGLLEFDVPVVASFAGTFHGGPSRVYPENAPSLSGWSPPLQVLIRGD